ncbi:MAG: hypothetical protein KIC89_22410 [Acetobacteraceae bacterium]|nr:hypothetical protein [Acetobacteraceae bacterium]
MSDALSPTKRDERGRPLATEHRDNPDFMAAWRIRHLERSGYLILKRPASLFPGQCRDSPGFQHMPAD